MKNNPKTRRRAAALIAAVLVSAAVSPARADGDPIALAGAREGRAAADLKFLD